MVGLDADDQACKMKDRLHKEADRSEVGGVSRIKAERGFTLVELLVVMLILGILAVIAVPAFYSQREKARDAEAKAQVSSAQLAAEAYAIDNQGRYTGATPAALAQIEQTLNDGDITVLAAGPRTYRLRSQSGSGNFFDVERGPMGSVYTCNAAGNGGCRPDGTW
jgi:prepilin-type N-terminal cleavage/methylation domain-containing protein